MRKEIKRWGNSAVIVLTKEDLKLRKLKVGDIVNIEELTKVNEIKGKEK
ncbi:hypothetical protein LCGC14_0784150 [marine sediment metagenome]|uniref:SpoVT-AbrB domain-containing protein n=1 Tax=marine sediment metagenome TaxID=412755 RepID=A0A0F9T1N8_9ZZZZ